MASSERVYFTSAKTVFKIVWNTDGRPWLTETDTVERINNQHRKRVRGTHLGTHDDTYSFLARTPPSHGAMAKWRHRRAARLRRVFIRWAAWSLISILGCVMKQPLSSTILARFYRSSCYNL